MVSPMDKEQRIKVITTKLGAMGETVNSWAKTNGLQHRIVADLIDGKLNGTHGVGLETRMVMEKEFGKVFES